MENIEIIYKLLRETDCSKDEKLVFAKLIRNIMGLSQCARVKGILELENFLYNSDIPFLLKKGLEYIVEGLCENEIMEILLFYTLSDRVKGKVLLEQLLIIEGTCMIAKCENPRLVRDKLTAMLGLQVSEVLINTKLNNIWTASVFGVSLEHWPYANIPNSQERKQLRVFHESSMKTDLAILNKARYNDLLTFFTIIEKSIYNKFKGVMPPELISKIEKDLCFEKCPTVEQASYVIKKILKIAFENKCAQI